MRKITTKVLTATAVTATAVALTALPASAGPLATWTSTPGGNVTGVNTVPLQALNMAKGVAAVCYSVTAGASIQTGSGLSGTAIASVNTLAPSSCVTTGSLVTTITPTNLPWTLDAASYDGSDVTTGSLNGVKATAVIGANPVQCTVTVTGPGGAPGSITGTFTNSTDTLGVSGSNLEVETATGPGCGSLAEPGDPLFFNGEVALAGLNSDQNITSP